jgi:hypothetical protein
MKYFIIILAVFIVGSCKQQTTGNQALQAKIDSLGKRLDHSYKPGFGEFMSGIQMHHAKLWFAGTNKNWELAQFEIDEIREAVEAITQYNATRPETKAIWMIGPSLDSVSNAIKQSDPQLFRSSYILLTNTCNSCHKVTEHAFNIITIPTTPPVSNQKF